MCLKLFCDSWWLPIVLKNILLCPAIMARYYWIELCGVGELVDFAGILVNPHACFDELAIEICIAIFIISEPTEGCRMIEAEVIGAEAVPMRWDCERFDEVNLLGYLLKKLSSKDIPVTVSISPSECLIWLGIESVHIIR